MRARTIITLLTLAGVGASTPFVINGCRKGNEPAPLVKEAGLPQAGGNPRANFPKPFSLDPKTLQLSLADDDTVVKLFPQGFKGAEKKLADFKDRVKKYNAVVAASENLLTVGPVDLRKNGQAFIPSVPPLTYCDLSTFLGCPIIMDPHNNMNPLVKGKITFNFSETALVDSFEDGAQGKKVTNERVKLHFTDDKGKRYDFMVPMEYPIIVIERTENGRPSSTYHIDVKKAAKPQNNNEPVQLF